MRRRDARRMRRRCARSRRGAPPPRSGPPRSRCRSGSDGGVTAKASPVLRLNWQAEALEDRGHLLRRHRHADHLLRARDAHAHRLALRQPRHGVDGRAGLAAADLEDQPRGALDAVDVVVEIDAALEAVRGVAREVVAPRAALDRVGPEERRLEEHVAACRSSALVLSPPMMPPRPIDAGVVGDAQHRRRRPRPSCSFSSSTFSPLRPQRTSIGAAQLVEVVDVQRPAELEHHVVGDVDQRRDRALAGALEALAHPFRRRRRGVDAADHAAGEAPAAFGRGDAHRDAVALLFAGDRLDRGRLRAARRSARRPRARCRAPTGSRRGWA